MFSWIALRDLFISAARTALFSASLLLKRHYDYGIYYKGKHLIVDCFQFQRLTHVHHDMKHGSVLADMVLEKES